MLKKLLLTTALCGAAITTFAMTNDTTTFTSNIKPLVVQQNQQFDIKLQSNPSTGFSWKLTSYEKPLVTFIGQAYVAPENQKPSVSAGAKTREATSGRRLHGALRSQFVLLRGHDLSAGEVRLLARSPA